LKTNKIDFQLFRDPKNLQTQFPVNSATYKNEGKIGDPPAAILGSRKAQKGPTKEDHTHMAQRKRKKIARENGAKAAGTKTPEGIQKSAMNAVRHGLTGKTLVLCNESQAQFDALTQRYIRKFQPQDEVDMELIDDLVAARWRLQRVRLMQAAT